MNDPAISHWLWTWIIFGIVFLILRKVAWKPLQEQLEIRANTIRETVDRAEQVKAEAEALLDRHRELMDRAKADAQAILDDGRAAAERAQKDALAQNEVEAKELLARARKEIDLEKRKALAEIRTEAVDLTIMAASQVLARSLDDDDHRRLTGDVIAEMSREGT
jgi:F-type H+-transporting ATPase subunit b